MKLTETLFNQSASYEKISSLLRTHIPALDGYRGMAILLVFLYHSDFSDPLYNSGFLNLFYEKLMKVGWTGVDAFFVLSGFLITGILLDTRSGSHFFRNFYIRRILRIWPIYYVVLIILIWLLPLVLNNNEFARQLSQYQGWYWLNLQNWLFISFVETPTFPTLHFWSLAVEEQFYLIWPLLIYFFPKQLLSWLCGTIILLAVAIRSWLLLTNSVTLSSMDDVYYNTFCRMDALATGALIALWMRSELMLPWLLRASRSALIFSGVSLSIIFAIQGDFDCYNLPLQYIGFSLLAIFFGALLVLVVAQPQDSLLVRVLTWSPLKRLGTISYGFYVYHFLVIGMLKDSLRQYSFNSQILNHLVAVLLYGVVTLIVSLLSWYCLERPILSLKTYFPSHQKDNVDAREVKEDLNLQVELKN